MAEQQQLIVFQIPRLVLFPQLWKEKLHADVLEKLLFLLRAEKYALQSFCISDNWQSIDRSLFDQMHTRARC